MSWVEKEYHEEYYLEETFLASFSNASREF